MAVCSRVMWRWVKRTLTELTVGASIGFVIWCLLGKQLTGMLFGSLGGSFSCRNDVEIGLDKFVAMQLYSAITGALLAFLGMLILRRWWAKSRARQAPPAVGAPGPVP
jgi:Mg/Co/Ni transporter MgtE